MTTTPKPDSPSAPNLHLRQWTDRAVVSLALISMAAGFGQFGVVAALGDVAKSFGRITHGTTVADLAGLSGTKLGVGLAIIRLASLGALPLAGLADRFGRRATIMATAVVGLATTVAAATSPSYWWFVVIFACGRPFLSSTSALAQVAAAELTDSGERARAVGFIAAGYGVGAGLIAIVHSLASGVLGFRGVLALSALPLATLPLLRTWMVEPDRFAISAAAKYHPLPVIGAVGGEYRRRIVVIAFITFAVSVITGPAGSFVFLYAQNFLHTPGYLTATMVAIAGPTGLAGLLLGIWMADHLGRRITCAIAIVSMALLGSLTYTGSRPALFIGYALAILAGSVFAPSGGALLNELFPTSVRASVTGWSVAAGVLGAVAGLLEFGTIADVDRHFAMASVITFLPATLAIGLFWMLPETRGKEPEELWPTT